MCGIVGLFFKRGAATSTLGPLLVGMLSQMTERGPDSTGFALYGDGRLGPLAADEADHRHRLLLRVRNGWGGDHPADAEDHIAPAHGLTKPSSRRRRAVTSR